MDEGGLFGDSHKQQTLLNTAGGRRPYEGVPDNLMGFRRDGPNKGFDDQKYKFEQPVRVTQPDGSSHVDIVKGLNKTHALARAERNWPSDARVEPIEKGEYDRALAEETSRDAILSTSGKEPGAKELEKAIAEQRPSILGADGAMGETHFRETTPDGEPIDKVIDAVSDIIRETVGPHVGIEFHDIIPTEGAATPEHLEAMTSAAKAGQRRVNRTAGGSARLPYRGEPAVISVALQDPIYDPRTTGFHESWHVVEFVALNEKERAFIGSKEAMEAVDSWAAEELGMMPNEPELQAMPAYERRAIAYQRYARLAEDGRPEVKGIPAALRAIWDRLTLMFKQVKTALAKYGVSRIEDVFDVSRLGGFADRIRADEPARADLASAASTSPETRISRRLASTSGDIRAEMQRRAEARGEKPASPPLESNPTADIQDRMARLAATRAGARVRPPMPGTRPSGEPLRAAPSPLGPNAKPRAAVPSPREAAPIKAGAPGVSRIGKDIEAKAVEAGLTNGFGETAGYDPLTIKEQAGLAADLVNKNPALARAIVKGDAPLPGRLRGTALITAMEERLRTHPSAEVAYELANSPLVSATSAAAQELRLAAERAPNSLTAIYQSIRSAREATVEKRGGVKKATKAATDEIRREIKRGASKPGVWKAFAQSIAC